jgi:LynF/TruF/PatF family peptide O-prenyltransferase
MLDEYPERVDRAIRLQGDDPRIRQLLLHDSFLVGFDLCLDGSAGIKLYPDIRMEETANARVVAAFSQATRNTLAECAWTHVYFARPGSPVVLQCHPINPDDFIRAHLDPRVAEPIHARYQGLRMLDMVVSMREVDLTSPVTEFALYYMPADERLV